MLALHNQIILGAKAMQYYRAKYDLHAYFDYQPVAVFFKDELITRPEMQKRVKNLSDEFLKNFDCIEISCKYVYRSFGLRFIKSDYLEA